MKGEKQGQLDIWLIPRQIPRPEMLKHENKAHFRVNKHLKSLQLITWLHCLAHVFAPPAWMGAERWHGLYYMLWTMQRKARCAPQQGILVVPSWAQALPVPLRHSPGHCGAPSWSSCPHHLMANTPLAAPWPTIHCGVEEMVLRVGLPDCNQGGTLTKQAPVDLSPYCFWACTIL